MDGDKRFRVYNRCVYDIGVTTTTWQQPNIKAGSFQILTVNDILYIESICNGKKFFSAKMLVPVDDNGNELTLEQLGGYVDERTVVHLDDNEIIAMLKKPNKSLEAWLKDIDDPVELHAVYEIAKTMDLPASKLKILNSVMPSKDWLGEDE